MRGWADNKNDRISYGIDATVTGLGCLDGLVFPALFWMSECDQYGRNIELESYYVSVLCMKMNGY